MQVNFNSQTISKPYFKNVQPQKNPQTNLLFGARQHDSQLVRKLFEAAAKEKKTDPKAADWFEKEGERLVRKKIEKDK